MADPRLVQYLRENIQQGYPADRLVTALRGQGWPEQEIQIALADVTGAKAPKHVPSPAAGTKPGLLGNIKNSFIHPRTLFSAIKDVSFSSVILTLVLVLVIGFGLRIVVSLLMSFLGSSPFDIVVWQEGSLFPEITGLISVLLGIVIGAGFLHLFAILLGGKGGYSGTLKAAVYGMIPAMLLSFLALVLVAVPIAVGIIQIVLFLWFLVLLIVGLKTLHKISGIRAILVVVTPIILVVALVVFLFSFALIEIFTIAPNDSMILQSLMNQFPV
ncbi:MAG: YIP1 family protein [Nanoarchaeota archaeon]|nr:YIP1 family protein [Nanoarchaeota archaeon]